MPCTRFRPGRAAPAGLGLDGGGRDTLSHAVQGGSIPCTACRRGVGVGFLLSLIVPAARGHTCQGVEHGDDGVLSWPCCCCVPSDCRRSAAASEARARTVTPTDPCALWRTDQSVQPWRGARHNATFREPAGRAAVVAPNEARNERSECSDFAECGVMLNARSTFTPERLCLCVACHLADGEARTQATQERASLLWLGCLLAFPIWMPVALLRRPAWRAACRALAFTCTLGMPRDRRVNNLRRSRSASLVPPRIAHSFVIVPCHAAFIRTITGVAVRARCSYIALNFAQVGDEAAQHDFRRHTVLPA